MMFCVVAGEKNDKKSDDRFIYYNTSTSRRRKKSRVLNYLDEVSFDAIEVKQQSEIEGKQDVRDREIEREQKINEIS